MRLGQNSWLTASLLLAVLSLVGGCSHGDTVERFELSGAVTLNNQPVPAGTIHFRPDESAGNSGPASVATIEAGEYHLEALHGIVGGNYLITIQAYDGKGQAIPGETTMTHGTPLIPEKMLRIELPRTSAEYDFQL